MKTLVSLSALLLLIALVACARPSTAVRVDSGAQEDSEDSPQSGHQDRLLLLCEKGKCVLQDARGQVVRAFSGQAYIESNRVISVTSDRIEIFDCSTRQITVDVNRSRIPFLVDVDDSRIDVSSDGLELVFVKQSRLHRVKRSSIQKWWQEAEMTAHDLSNTIDTSLPVFSGKRRVNVFESGSASLIVASSSSRKEEGSAQTPFGDVWFVETETEKNVGPAEFAYWLNSESILLIDTSDVSGAGTWICTVVDTLGKVLVRKSAPAARVAIGTGFFGVVSVDSDSSIALFDPTGKSLGTLKVKGKMPRFGSPIFLSGN